MSPKIGNHVSNYPLTLTINKIRIVESDFIRIITNKRI